MGAGGGSGKTRRERRRSRGQWDEGPRGAVGFLQPRTGQMMPPETEVRGAGHAACGGGQDSVPGAAEAGCGDRPGLQAGTGGPAHVGGGACGDPPMK